MHVDQPFTTPINPCSSKPQSHSEFLLQAAWDNNASVLDENGKPLRREDYAKLKLCRLSEVIVFGSKESYAVSEHSVLIRLPSATAKRSARHKQNVLRWCVNILGSVPWNLWGIKKKLLKPIALPTLRHQLQWGIQDEGDRPTMAATHFQTEYMTVLHLARDENGITWRITWADRDFRESDDFMSLRHGNAS
ncbi:hypothetical protein PHYSODRAFT_299492 [Phytophthora sojae]|uniref:Uncharacterized protein n=1 Tax=Phytophthora sojae (strain P6497) TaxID=1094619 RepID=G4Z9F1_PHYSP|nr:hypothetical protein PHYSODRAFT_299492 [Phytophthora sojae]EGZ21952.1 hypothetical protein PHYSODRAFT_299492 [Phytophthora sojae]|eukprot:XP_009524669.1 hypothetical protein PHYSODRAFT_299492 [Phytophthora sojae]